MEKDDNIIKEAEEEAKRIHDLEAPTDNKGGKGKPNKALLVIVVIIFMAFIFGCGLYLGKQLFEDKNSSKKENTSRNIENTEKNTNNEIKEKDDNNTTNTNTETNTTNNHINNNQIDEKIINELVNIAGFKSDARDSHAEFYYYDGVINDYNIDIKSSVVFAYALRNGKTVTVSGSESSYCMDGSGSCLGINIDDYNEISKKYGLDSFVPQIYGHDCYTYNGMYLFNYGGSTTSYSSAEQDYSYEIVNDDIIFTDKIEYIAIPDSGIDNLTVVKIFTFKKNLETGNYYLYSVFTKQ